MQQNGFRNFRKQTNKGDAKLRVQNDKNGFAERLRELAFKKGANYTDIANATEVATRQSVSLWMKGKMIPKAATLQKLADFFDCTPEYLLFGTGKSNVNKTPSLDELAMAIVEMRDLLKEIRDELKNGKDDGR